MSEPVSNTEIEDVLTSIRRLLAEDPKAGDRGTGKRTEPSIGRGVEPSFFQGNEPTISRPSEAPVSERSEPQLTRPAEAPPEEPAKLVLTPAHRVSEAPVAKIPDVLRAPEDEEFGATGPAEIPPAVEPVAPKAPDLDAVFDRIDAAEAEPPKPDPLVLHAEEADDLPIGEAIDLDPIYEMPEEEQRPEPRRSFASAIFSRLTDMGQRDRAKPSDPGVARFTAKESSVEPFTPRASEPKTPVSSEPVPLPKRNNQDLSLEDRIAELEAAVGAQDEEWEPDGSEMQSSGYVFDESEEPAALPSFEAESSAFDTARDTLRLESDEVLTPSALAREMEAKVEEPAPVEEAELIEDDDEDDGPMADVLQSVIEKEIAAALARLEAKGAEDAEEVEAESVAEPVEETPKSPLVLRMPEADPAPLDATTAARRLTLGGLDLSRLSLRPAEPEVAETAQAPEEAEADPLRDAAEADPNPDNRNDPFFAEAAPKGPIFQTQNRVTPEVDEDWETEAEAAFGTSQAELPETEEPSWDDPEAPRWDSAGGPLANSAAVPRAEYGDLDDYDEFFRGPEDQPAEPEAWEPDAEFAEAEALLTGSAEPEATDPEEPAFETDALLSGAAHEVAPFAEHDTETEAVEAAFEADPLEPRSEYAEAEALLTGSAEPLAEAPVEEPQPNVEDTSTPEVDAADKEALMLHPVDRADVEALETETDIATALDSVETAGLDAESDESSELGAVETPLAEPAAGDTAMALDSVKAAMLDVEADETPAIDPVETSEAAPIEAENKAATAVDSVESEEAAPLETATEDTSAMSSVETLEIARPEAEIEEAQVPGPVETSETTPVEAEATVAVDPVETADATPPEAEARETLVPDPVETAGAGPLEAEEALELKADEVEPLGETTAEAEPLEVEAEAASALNPVEAESELVTAEGDDVSETLEVSETGSLVEAAVEAALEADGAEPATSDDQAVGDEAAVEETEVAEAAEEAPSKPEPLRLENPVEPLPEGQGEASPPENFEFVPEAPKGSTVIPLPRGEAERVRLETAAEVDTPRIGDLTPPEPGELMEADNVFDDPMVIDEDMLRDMVGDIIRQELQGELGERITRNVRKLVRREIYKALASKDFE